MSAGVVLGVAVAAVVVSLVSLVLGWVNHRRMR
jgi:hypothetical protein